MMAAVMKLNLQKFNIQEIYVRKCIFETILKHIFSMFSLIKLRKIFVWRNLWNKKSIFAYGTILPNNFSTFKNYTCDII